jgi:hypothetical protein
VLLYWGWHWRQVYDSAHLIAAQLVFAYAFDMLLDPAGLRALACHEGWPDTCGRADRAGGH